MLSVALGLIPGWREGSGLNWLTRSALPPPGCCGSSPATPRVSPPAEMAKLGMEGGRCCGGLLSVHAFCTESLSWAARGPCAEGAGLAWPARLALQQLCPPQIPHSYPLVGAVQLWS